MNLLKISTVFASAALATSAFATSLTVADAIGNVDPGSPASIASEVVYVNHLLNDVPSLNTITAIDGHNYVKFKVTSSLPDAVEAGAVKQNSENEDKTPNVNFTPGNIDVSGWTYLLAKYADVSYVWFVGDLVDGIASIASSIQVPVQVQGSARRARTEMRTQGLSHYTLFNPTAVPDTTSTLALFGMGLAALGAIARRRKV